MANITTPCGCEHGVCDEWRGVCECVGVEVAKGAAWGERGGGGSGSGRGRRNVRVGVEVEEEQEQAVGRGGGGGGGGGIGNVW